MKLNYIDKTGKVKSDKFDFDVNIVEVPNESLISQYIFVYLSNQRQTTAKAKDRSERSGGGRKPFRQKGTGNARAGSNRSPIWRGGGITFGPTGEENYKKSMLKKMRIGAFQSALRINIDNDNLVVSEDPEVKNTKEAVGYISNYDKDVRKVLIVQSDENKYSKMFKNISNVSIVRIGELNTYDLVNSTKIIVLESAIDSLKNRLNK